jgi:serine/threonine protein kinase
MAPEILSSFERRPSMDIFSFGISVYEIFLTTLQENRRAHHDPEVESSYSSSSSSSGSMPDLLHAGGATAKAIPRPGFAGLLPFDGPRWHALRSGAADPVRTISAELREIVSSMMAAEAEARPTSVEVLRTPMVFQAKQDLFLSSYAPAAAKVHIARSHSYKESMVSCFNSDSVAFVGLTRAFATPKFFMLLKNHFVFTMLPLHVHDKPPLNNEIAVFVLKLK